MGNNNPIKQGGDKPIFIDIHSFKPKSINQIVSQAELNSHLQSIRQKQDSIKKYKYYQDFDRISVESQRQVVNFAQLFQNTVKYNAIVALFVTKFYINYHYKSYVTLSLYKRYYFPVFAALFSVSFLASLAAPHFHVINNDYFRQNRPQQSLYRALDQQMNLYQYVDDIKYNFDYSQSDIMKTRKDYWAGYIKQAKNNIQRRYGINKSKEQQNRQK